MHRGACLGVFAFSLSVLSPAASLATTAGKATPGVPTQETRGRFSVLTYNVAGLPEFISQSDPVRNIPVISGLLNLYDVAFVQEDFAYHPELAARALHPYQTPPVIQNERTGIGDGLNTFSRLAFSTFERVTWSSCFGKLSDGADCLAPKGFTMSVHQVAPGIEIDMYNLHMDSGGSAGDIAARSEQVAQLLSHMERRSKGRPVVVAGDTNTSADTEVVLETFRTSQGLTDACRALRCPKPSLIDRVLYRGVPGLALRAVTFSVDARFVRRDGGDLSDHKAVGVQLEWRRVAEDTTRPPAGSTS
jgi:hypothetical protein